MYAGKTDHINLKRFYPFLACLAEAARFNPNKPPHRAMGHAILNSPNPGARPTDLPDGSAANLVVLGEPVSHSDVIGWWRSAASSPVRSKLFRRIQREGYLLPILTSICVALLRDMYTTSPDGQTRHRVRLQFGSSPISDFGIAKGQATVTSQDRLAYPYLSDDTFEAGQDPENHYWIYFRNLKGQTVTLDVGMFTFNLYLYVSGQPYFKDIHSVMIPPVSAPAYFVDREMLRSAPNATKMTSEFSFLRNAQLQAAVASQNTDWAPVFRLMKAISGSKLTTIETRFTKDVVLDSCRAMMQVIQNRS
ncbi:hypothetical protein H0H81_005616 [Sphagnurus paluster]|uniref:Uncharacterized protein n=1 Tax=Sphagnurus paluster TaxID=117069 RepID=A0A9P7GPI0_9AGAR|nr:hypothetical protein H0H81_005616 [Sphagnurus paluster]